MKTHPTTQTFDCLDVELRVRWLEVNPGKAEWTPAMAGDHWIPDRPDKIQAAGARRNHE